ncbi:MAG: hypothetical protein KBG15_05020 [Kofleriaceae bacterium]|nr:hypothetical protein [Kofleriaceae bacterium]
MNALPAAGLGIRLRAIKRATTALAFVVIVAVGLAACPAENQNPERLWLSLDGVETRVRLVPVEPEPF